MLVAEKCSMHALKFFHQFFHFSLADWQKFWANRAEADPIHFKEAETLFKRCPFSKRSLKIGLEFSFSEACREYEKIEKLENRLGIISLPFNHPDYPQSLYAYLTPEKIPPILYLRGAKIKNESAYLAIVGTRRPSFLGMESARNFSSYFTALNVSVVSGLAKGIDTLAHQENLKAGTVAVLGSGIDEVYPTENQSLAEKICAEGGTLLSQFPLQQIPFPYNFPIRNEVIAALSCGTLVVEGSEKSGAAVTGKLALSMGKTVTVLSQDYRSQYGRGAIRLYEAGAIFVCSEEEALQALYARIGGFPWELPRPMKEKTRIFSLEDFQKMMKKSLPESIALLEEAILVGKIERVHHNRYRLKKPASNANNTERLF